MTLLGVELTPSFTKQEAVTLSVTRVGFCLDALQACHI